MSELVINKENRRDLLKEIVVRVILILLFMLTIFVDNTRCIGFLGSLARGVLRFGFFVPVLGSVALFWGIKKKNRLLGIIYSIPWLIALFILPKLLQNIDGVGLADGVMITLDLWWGSFIAVSMIKEAVMVLRQEPGMSFLSFIRSHYETEDLGYILFFLLFFLSSCMGKSKQDLPFFTGIVFLLLYMTPFQEKDRERLSQMLCTGVIMGFWIMQILAFAFRPYDSVRYHGMYVNTNSFSMVCMMIVFLSFIKLEEYRAYKAIPSRIIYIFYVLETCGTFSLLCLTIGRASIFITVLGMGIALWILFKKRGAAGNKNVGKYILKIAGSLGAFLVVFAITFAAVRYIPAYLRHPLYFADEYFKKNAVYYDDPVDSEKYVEFDEYLSKVLGRFILLFYKEYESEPDNDIGALGDGEDTFRILDPAYPDNTYYLSEQYSGIECRIGIVRSYLDRMNFLGHSDGDQIVWISPYESMQHSHNIFIQMAYSYGILSGLIFVSYIIVCILFCVLKLRKGRKHVLLYMLICIGTLGYGLFDCTWQIGQLPWFLFLFAPMLCFGGEQRDKEQE